MPRTFAATAPNSKPSNANPKRRLPIIMLQGIDRLSINNSAIGRLSITSENKLHFPGRFDIDLAHVFAVQCVPVEFVDELVASRSAEKVSSGSVARRLKNIFKTRSSHSIAPNVSGGVEKDSDEFTSVAVDALSGASCAWEKLRIKSLPTVIDHVMQVQTIDKPSDPYCVILFTLAIQSRPIDKGPPRFIAHVFTPNPACGQPCFDFFAGICLHVKKSSPKNALILLNPWGGLKKARSIYSGIVQPMFRLAAVEHTLIETERPLHAADIGESFDISKFDALVTISGDGLFHELLNGIMKRADWRKVLSIPIGIIPAGT